MNYNEINYFICIIITISVFLFVPFMLISPEWKLIETSYFKEIFSLMYVTDISVLGG